MNEIDYLRKQKHYQNNNLFSPDEAIQYGTAFKALAIPYKNYKTANVVATNEKERLMLDIQKYDLVCHDLGLYLDVFPNDGEIINIRDNYLKMLRESEEKYEKKYSPFNKCSDKLDKVPFSWSTSPFPWGGK